MKRKRLIVLSLILISAFLLRLVALNQSLWLDEGITARVVREFGLSGILTRFSPNDFHPPLYYLIMHLWSRIFGNSEIMLRFPSVIFAMVAGIFTFKLANSLTRNFQTANWAMAFFLFNPLVIYYSQEARMYMMATMFVTGGMYYLSRIMHRASESPKVQTLDGLAAGLFLSLALATFYGSVLIIIPLLGYLIYKRMYRVLSVVCCLLFVTGLILFPLLYQQLLNAHGSLSVVVNWKSVLGTASLKNLVLIFVKFTSGRISFEPKILYYVIAGIWSLVIWSLVIRGGLKNKTFFLLIICTLSLGIVFSFITPLLQYFRFLFLIPLMAILIAFGTEKTIVKTFVLAGFIFWSLAYLLFPQFHREDWKSLSDLIPWGQPVYAIPASMDALTYYRPDLKTKILDIRSINHVSRITRQVSKDPQSVIRDSLTIIPYTSEIYGFDYHKVLSTIGYAQRNVQSVRSLTVETWSKQ